MLCASRNDEGREEELGEGVGEGNWGKDEASKVETRNEVAVREASLAWDKQQYLLFYCYVAKTEGFFFFAASAGSLSLFLLPVHTMGASDVHHSGVCGNVTTQPYSLAMPPSWQRGVERERQMERGGEREIQKTCRAAGIIGKVHSQANRNQTSKTAPAPWPGRP